MRERGWCEAGVTKPRSGDSDRTSGPMEASGLGGLGWDVGPGLGCRWRCRGWMDSAECRAG